mgnify:CR=1 FL=1
MSGTSQKDGSSGCSKNEKRMRSELEQIESIERYLEGKMSGAELNSFEAKMNADTHFQQEVANQGVIIERIQTIGKMQAMDAAHQNHVKRAAYKGWAIKGLVGVTAVSAAIAGGKFLADWNNSGGEESALVVGTDENDQQSSNKPAADTKLYQDDSTVDSTDPENGPTNPSNVNDLSVQNDHSEQEDTLKGKSKEKTGEAETKAEDKAPKDEGVKSNQKTEGFRIEGAKMFLLSDDEHAKIHFEREVSIYDTWKWVESKEEAEYTIKLRYKKQGLDRLSWIEILDSKGDQVYRSIQSRGINGGMRTVNLKQASVEQLVHEILAYEFFGMK